MIRVFCVAVLIWGALAVWFVANADERKDALRLQYTEFCAVVKPPPEALVKAVEMSFGLEPAKWAASMMWLQKLAEAYHNRGCADA